MRRPVRHFYVSDVLITNTSHPVDICTIPSQSGDGSPSVTSSPPKTRPKVRWKDIRSFFGSLRSTFGDEHFISIISFLEFPHFHPLYL